MKLLGRTNNKIVIASVSRHDYNGIAGMFVDGGVNGTFQGGGYYRCGGEGKTIWFQIPETFAELYNDYRDNRANRKYGIWKLEDVKILSPEECPDTESFEWQAENAIWGTNGIDGDFSTTYVHLKDCSKEHLEKIIELCRSRGEQAIPIFAEYWLAQNAKTKDHQNGDSLQDNLSDDQRFPDVY